jgi:hypothetical protein
MGRTAAEDTPLAVRSRVPLPEGMVERVRASLGRSLGHTATRIERASLRFEDVNGPRGGLDTMCRIKVVMSGRPSIIVEQRGRGAADAFARAQAPLLRSVRRSVDRRGGKRPAATLPAKPPSRPGRPRAAADPGSYIGRRVGRGPANLKQALARPEKQRRDAYVDTAAPGVSASDRRAGGPSTARRNARNPRSGMVATLEDSRAPRPSRKSTRRSAGSTKAATKLTRRRKAHLATPRSRHTRGA